MKCFTTDTNNQRLQIVETVNMANASDSLCNLSVRIISDCHSQISLNPSMT